MSDQVLAGLDSQLVSRFGVPPWFSEYREKLRRGELKPASKIDTTFSPPKSGDIASLPKLGTPEAKRLEERGLKAIRDGKVAVVVLAGGMATRFGGVVKGVVEVVRGKSFIELKLEDARRAARLAGGNKKIPFFMMTSFATHEAIQEHLRARKLEGDDIHLAPQHIAARLTREGEFFRDEKGQLSYYGPGHGDFFDVFRTRMPELKRMGVELLLFSNVDNLGATVDPRVIGFHLEQGKDVTVREQVCPSFPARNTWRRWASQALERRPPVV